MQADGLTPIAFGDKDGWPAMGTFDILNLRQNGYDFHVNLMAGKEKWTDSKVTDVFKKWAEIVPFHAKDYAGLTWQHAAGHARPEEGRACTCSACSSRRSSPRRRTRRTSPTSTSSRSRRSGPQFDAENALDAPIDTWQIAAKSPNLAAETDAAKAYLEFWAKGATQLLMFKNQPGLIPTAKDADTSTYSALQKKAVGDRLQGARRSPSSSTATPAPTSPGRTACRRFLQTFLANPTQDLAAYQKTIQDFWDSLPPLT